MSSACRWRTLRPGQREHERQQRRRGPATARCERSDCAWRSPRCAAQPRTAVATAVPVRRWRRGGDSRGRPAARRCDASRGPDAGRSPGSPGLGPPAFPSVLQDSGAWERPALAYRCGGSRGLARGLPCAAPPSRFTRREGCAADTCGDDCSLAGPRRKAPRAPALCYNPRPSDRTCPHGITTRPGAPAVAAKLYIRTFGCQMNEYDSDKMADVLARRRRPRRSPSVPRTPTSSSSTPARCARRRRSACSTTSAACARSRRSNPDLIIGVGGCVASQEGAAIVARAPYVDVVFGPQTLHRLPADDRATARHRTRRRSTSAFPRSRNSTTCRRRASTAPSAFVSIMEGCSKYCTFCVVPYTRGEEVSRPFDDVLTEVADLADQGVRRGHAARPERQRVSRARWARAARSPISRRCSNTSPRSRASSASATRRRTRRR